MERPAVADLDLGAGGVGPLGSLSSSSTIIERFGALALAAAEDGVFEVGALECRSIGDILPGSALKVELLTPPDTTLRFSTQKKGISELKGKDCLNL